MLRHGTTKYSQNDTQFFVSLCLCGILFFSTSLWYFFVFSSCFDSSYTTGLAQHDCSRNAGYSFPDIDSFPADDYYDVSGFLNNGSFSTKILSLNFITPSRPQDDLSTVVPGQFSFAASVAVYSYLQPQTGRTTASLSYKQL